jgi:hypothetical protein
LKDILVGRIQGVPEKRAGLLARLSYRYSKRTLGKVVEPIAVSAHNTSILAAYGAFEFALQRARRVEEKLKVLAELKAGTLVGCPF